MRRRGGVAPVEDALARAFPDLRGRLVFVAPVALALLVALALALAWRQYEDAKKEATADLRTRAVLAATVLDTYFAGQLQTLSAIASSPPVRAGDVDAMTRFFARFRPPSGTTFTAGVGWIDLQGRQRATSAPGGPVAASLADRSYFRRVVATRKPFVAEAIVARASKRRLVVMGVPTLDDRGRLSGVLAGGIVLPRSTDDARANDLGYQGLELIDRTGQQVTRRSLAVPPNGELLAEIRKRREGVIVDATGLHGSSGRVVAFASSPTPGWTTVIDQPASVVFADARRALLLEVALVVGAALLVLGLIVWAVRRARRDFRAGRAQVRRWAALTRSLNEAADAPEVADVLAKALAEELPSASVVVGLVAKASDQAALAVVHGRRSPLTALDEASARAIVDLVAAADEPVTLETRSGIDRELHGAAGPSRAASLYGVPLADGNGGGGAVALLFPRERALGEHQLSLARAHADQAEQALARVRRYEEEHDVAVLLQESLLPHELPETDGLKVSAHYRAGALNTTVGGDWYDVVRRPDGIVHLTVGDVAGRGIDAAISMGQIRNAFRAYALEHETPGAVVQRLARHVPDDGMATMICATYDPYTRELTYASAGHLPPLLLDPASRTVERLDYSASGPLGWIAPSRDDGAEITVPVDATLVLYTDGLVERRDSPLDAGIERLVSALTGDLPEDPQDTATTLVARMVEPRTDDDLAVLVVRLCAAPGVVSIRLPAEARRLRELRRRVRAWLEHHGLEPSAQEAAVLALSEACNNAIEHGYRDEPGTIDIRLEHRGRTLGITVEDEGEWREPREETTRGRGLVLMRGLMEKTELVRRPNGTSVVLEQQL